MVRGIIGDSRTTMSVHDTADSVLTKQELLLAERLHSLIESKRMKEASTLLDRILPKYWKKEDGRFLTPEPIAVYRSVFYLHTAPHYHMAPRYMIQMMGQHIESLLGLMLQRESSRRRGKLTFGVMVKRLLSHGTISENLAERLFQFNNLYVRAKHMTGDPRLPRTLTRRTFSSWETVLCLIITRQLSMLLFDLLRKSGSSLPHSWEKIKPEWIANVEE